LLAVTCQRLEAQVGNPAPPSEWRACAFARVGGSLMAPSAASAGGDKTLLALTGGAAVSRGMAYGMLRAAYTDGVSWDTPNSGVQDYAVLAGMRSRGNLLFATGAVGLARATPVGGSNDLYSPHPDRRPALAYDLSIHSDYRVGGFALALSGVAGSARLSYLALSLGAELGWFGRP